MSTTSTSPPTATSSSAASSTTTAADALEGQTITSFITALAVSLVIFAIQLIAFILLRNKLARIYKPKTYLVTERERTESPSTTPWGWLTGMFSISDRELIKKCGLDAYFFLRYLQTLLVIFVPLAIIILPILIPINYVGGRGSNFASEGDDGSGVSGLDTIAWGNIKSSNTNRYWAHLLLAILVVVWVCGVVFFELRVYIKVRQDYLTSAEHRLRASATTVLVSAIPPKWLTHEALAGLFDVYPGGIRNIWINRNFDPLLDKIKERQHISTKLESAETELIRNAKKAQVKKLTKERKKQGRKQSSKEEKTQELARANAAAQRLAEGGGTSSGDQGKTPHTISDVVDEENDHKHDRNLSNDSNTFKKGFKTIGQGFGAVGQGLHTGFGAVGQGIQGVGKGLGAAGTNVVDGMQGWGTDINQQIETTNGFVNFDRRDSIPDEFDKYGRYVGQDGAPPPVAAPAGAGVHSSTLDNMEGPDSRQPQSSGPSPVPSDEDDEGPGKLPGNKVRRELNLEGLQGANQAWDRTNWWRFWQGPSGGFASPIPTGWEGEEFPLTRGSDEAQRSEQKKSKSIWVSIKQHLPFVGPDLDPFEYSVAYNEEYKEDASGAEWEKYLRLKDRPTHRLAHALQPNWMTMPFINKKVDTIYWCREHLARLNLEIETDQKTSERFPLMNSAFIQFNHQVAAHMACQSAAYHIPKTMAPRMVEISPSDVIWDNMSVLWWQAWLKSGAAMAIVVGIIIGYLPLVAWSATLSNLAVLSRQYSFLSWLQKIDPNIISAIGGVLPALVLGLLLLIIPWLLGLIGLLQGSQTGRDKQGFVQTYYFAFLFVQVFFVVTITGSVAAAFTYLSDITSIPSLLATSLPKAANYFFSYMILQALSVSSGTLLQPMTLLVWFVFSKILDSTARDKWRRNTKLPSVTWGSTFPVYTNFACIAIIYSVVSPVIILFAIITFTLLWIANRYRMLYVTRLQTDTGGVLYPRAINQTFTGLYIMEVCLIGLFFLVENEQLNQACVPQAVIMIVVAVFTVLYQILLNRSFGPLLTHLPITFEDEAVLRDQAFERMQAKRLGLDDSGEDDEMTPIATDGTYDNIELENIGPQRGASKYAKINPVNLVQGAGSWALRSGKQFSAKAFAKDSVEPGQAPVLARRKRQSRQDLEAQRAIGNALYGGYNDEIEDLTPDERDALVRHAFQHAALRARRPTVWIPRDDLGVSDDEIKRTRDFGNGNIWISNVGAALDGKQRVIYGKNPPDFSEVDLINL